MMMMMIILISRRSCCYGRLLLLLLNVRTLHLLHVGICTSIYIWVGLLHVLLLLLLLLAGLIGVSGTLKEWRSYQATFRCMH